MTENKKVVYFIEEEHPVKILPYWYVWVALLILTIITVWAKYLHLGRFSMIIALIIATTKVSLVAGIFMHLYYEKTIFKVIIGIAIFILLIFIGLTFIDVLFR
jgi:caa(3)-type oxidase subunit IV